MLEDCDQHPRERRRFELTAELIAASGAEAVRIETEGETRIARLLWAMMLGDLVSLELADARGVDPLPVDGDRGPQGPPRPRVTPDEGDRSWRRSRHPAAADHLRDAEADGAGG